MALNVQQPSPRPTLKVKVWQEKDDRNWCAAVDIEADDAWWDETHLLTTGHKDRHAAFQALRFEIDHLIRDKVHAFHRLLVAFVESAEFGWHLYLTAVAREDARALGKLSPTEAYLKDVPTSDEVRRLLAQPNGREAVMQYAGLSEQEQRAISLKGDGFSLMGIQNEMQRKRSKRKEQLGADTLPLETLERYLRSGRAKLREAFGAPAE